MKMNIIRIEGANKAGISKKGEPYTLDFTRVTVEVPFSTPDGWGTKEMTYEYGTYANLAKLEALRDKLPMTCDVELTMGTDQYERPTTVISSVQVPSAINKA